MLQKSEIEELIPHAGDMSLLDGVAHWDAETIVCVSTSHHRDSNPLREDGQLAAMALVEYAAQAAAVHAALVGAGIGGERTALIGAVKGLVLHQRVVQPQHTELSICASNILQSAEGAIYEICVEAKETPLIEARVVLLIPQ